MSLTKAELDGEDILANSIAQDAFTHRISVQGITLGEHTLRYNGEDAVGNTNATDRILTFTVLDVPTWRLSLAPGMNLISVPSAPSDGDINAIFGDSEEIDLIFTFEGGQSLVALRDQDSGQFVGTLKNIDAMHAYWVSVANTAHIDIAIPPASQFTALPFLDVKAGQWTLVPVMSLGKVNDPTPGEGAAPNTVIDPDAYFGDFRTAFGWSGRSWVKYDPDDSKTDDIGDDEDAAPIRIGMGYWVLYNEVAIITP